MSFDSIFDQIRGIHEVAATAGRSESKADHAVEVARRIEARLDQLTLINMALWSLLKERTGLTEEDLARRMQEIDLSDGQLDGKVRVPVTSCPRCQRAVSRKHNRCLFCGGEPEVPDPFGPAAR
jgi:hypothetical protein